jgi:hypothetical protein
MDYYTEEQKILLDELSLKAERLAYAVRYDPRDPARLQLISRQPSFLEEKDRWKKDFYNIDDLANFLAAEASAPETRMCWRLQISIAPPDHRYEKPHTRCSYRSARPSRRPIAGISLRASDELH